MALIALAAHHSDPEAVRASAEASARAATRVGWRVLAVPLACNLASLMVLAIGYGDRLPPAARWLALGSRVPAPGPPALPVPRVRASHRGRGNARCRELSRPPHRA